MRARRSTPGGLVLLVGALIAFLIPAAAARAATVDLSAAVSISGDIPIGGSATSTITVSNVGADPASGTTTATLLVPANATVSSPAGTGWSCGVTTAQRVDCTSTDAVAGGGSFPTIAVTVSGTGSPLAGVQYAIVAGGGETNTANDLARGVVRVVQPPSGADQMYLQLAGAFGLRVGGAVDSGNLVITRDVFGLKSVTGTATIGTTSATFNVQRQWFPTPYTGNITITSPNVQGGTPLTVPVRAGVSDGGGSRQAWGDTGFIVIPALDLGGIIGALRDGILFDLNWTVADFSPTAPPPNVVPPTYRPPASAIGLALSAPARVQTGQAGNISANVSGIVGVTDGPITIVANAPDGLTPSGGGSGTSCESAGTWQVCTLNSTVTTPLGVGGSVSADIRFTPTVPTTTIPLTAFADTPNDTILTNGNEASTVVDVRSPGPDLTVSMSGPEVTSALWFNQGSASSNSYAITATNVGSATSGTVTAVLTLGPGLTFNSSSGSGWSCSVTTPPSEVTCTRSGLGTSILNRSSTVNVRVDADPAAQPSTTSTVVVSSPGDVAPSVPDKTASATTPTVGTNPATISYTFSNGAATLTNAPVVDGSLYVAKTGNTPTHISGCGTSRRWVPANILQLQPSRVDVVRLCVNLGRFLWFNSWTGSINVQDVRGPISLPPPVPSEVPPLGSPTTTFTTGNVLMQPLTQLGPNTFGGSASATNPEYALSGGSRFTINWSVTLP